MPNELNFAPKLRGDRSKLYRRRFLQVNSTKYSLESSRRDLHNALLCTVLQSQNFSQKSSFFFSRMNIDFIFFFRAHAIIISAIFNEKIEIRERFPNFRLWIPKTVQRSALCRSRRELSNEYLLVKIGLDTTENEP